MKSHISKTRPGTFLEEDFIAVIYGLHIFGYKNYPYSNEIGGLLFQKNISDFLLRTTALLSYSAKERLIQ